MTSNPDMLMGFLRSLTVTLKSKVSVWNLTQDNSTPQIFSKTSVNFPIFSMLNHLHLFLLPLVDVALELAFSTTLSLDFSQSDM